MFVSRSMTRKVITVDQEAAIFDAQELLAKNKIRHLPIVDKDRRLIGIITDRDIRSALPYSSLIEQGSEEEKERVAKLKVKDFMTKDPITVFPTYTIQDALLLIQNAKVGALPVVDVDRAVGEHPDVLAVLFPHADLAALVADTDALVAIEFESMRAAQPINHAVNAVTPAVGRDYVALAGLTAVVLVPAQAIVVQYGVAVNGDAGNTLAQPRARQVGAEGEIVRHGDRRRASRKGR